MASQSSRFARSLILLAGCGALTVASAQVAEKNGFRLYDISLSAGYSSGANDFLPVRYAGAESSLMGQVSLSAGYSYSGPRRSVALIYSPSYWRTDDALLRSFSQNLMFSVNSLIGSKWRGTFAASGVDSSMSQVLFMPSTLSQIEGLPGTFQDVSGAIVGSGTSDAQLSALTGGSLVDSLSRGLIYGDRFFTVSLRTGLSYQYSSRLSLNFNAGGSRSQSRMNDDVRTAMMRDSIIPRTTAAQGGFSLQYLLTPRVQTGFGMDTIRVFAGPNEYYVTSATGTIGRNFTRRLFASVSAGAGKLTPVHGFAAYSDKPSFTGSATTGYNYGSHTFMASYHRAVGDSYGFGALASDGVSAAWDWRKPRRRWGFNLSGGREQIRRGEDIVTWQGAASIGLRISSETSMSFSGSYLSSTVPYFTVPNLHGWSARVSFIWTPRGRWASVPR